MKSLKNRKAFTIMQLKLAVRPVEPEEKMIFGILAQAIEDIDNPIVEDNSRGDWRNNHLAPVCETLGLDYEYVCRVINKNKLLPFELGMKKQ